MEMLCLAKDKVKTTKKAKFIFYIQFPACKEHCVDETEHVSLHAFMNMGVDLIIQCSNI